MWLLLGSFLHKGKEVKDGDVAELGQRQQVPDNLTPIARVPDAVRLVHDSHGRAGYMSFSLIWRWGLCGWYFWSCG